MEVLDAATCGGICRLTSLRPATGHQVSSRVPGAVVVLPRGERRGPSLKAELPPARGANKQLPNTGRALRSIHLEAGTQREPGKQTRKLKGEARREGEEEAIKERTPARGNGGGNPDVSKTGGEIGEKYLGDIAGQPRF